MKCKFCKWYKVAGSWLSECKNSNSEFYDEECIEKIGAESQSCDVKEEE